VTAFAGRLQGRPPTGPELRLFKDQLAALAAANIRLGFARSQEHATTINTQIVQGFDVWMPKNGLSCTSAAQPRIVLLPRLFSNLMRPPARGGAADQSWHGRTSAA
jgi:hypothetical protein